VDRWRWSLSLRLSDTRGYEPQIRDLGQMAVVAAAVFLKVSLARAVPKLLIATEDDAEALDALTGCTSC